MPDSLRPKTILLVSDSPKHKAAFDRLCENKEFVICAIIGDSADILDNLQNNSYDLIIASSELKDVDLISFFYDNQIQIDEKIPIIFILQSAIEKSKMRFFENLKVSLLYEDYLDVNFLDYSLKTALQKHKILRLAKENEFRFRRLYDHTLDMNLVIDNDLNVVDVNVQGRKQLKFQEAFPFKNIFVNVKKYEKFMALLNEIEQVSRFEVDLKLKGKKTICLIDAFTLYNTEQERTGAHIVIRNVDKARKSQKLANQASKLLVTGKFLRSLAHEIRNPLTNINLALEQINHDSKLDEDGKLYIDVVKRSSNRIASLLEEIMDAYKTSEITLENESLHNIIDNALMFANDRLMLKNIKLNLKYRPTDDMLMADKLKLTTAILNLVVNASEAITHEKCRNTTPTYLLIFPNRHIE